MNTSTVQYTEIVEDEQSVIDISDDEDDMTALNEYAANPAIRDFIILDDDDGNEQPRPPPPPRTSNLPIRNAPPVLPRIYKNVCQLISELAGRLGPTAQQVKGGDTVELYNIGQPGIQPGDFLRVLEIIEDLQTGEVTLRGLQFRRNKHLQPMLPRKLNEVYMIVSVDADDSRPFYKQGMQEVPLASALRKRRLVVTDLPFPQKSFRDHVFFDTSGHNAARIRAEIAANEVLVCRNIFVYIYAAGERRRRSRPNQGLLRFVGLNEADNAGGLLLTGSQAVEVDLTAEDSDPEEIVLAERALNRRPSRQRQYTFGDGFSGGGGASCAARLAGLKVQWGFDHDPQAAASMRTNFRRARIFEVDVFDFPPRDFNPRIDILHISPPCQPYSPARNGTDYAANDDNNIAALFSVGEIIRAVNPKLVTLEETFGLFTYEKHQKYFQALISMIHREGYSVRWAILNFKEYGLPQPRKRIVFIAAAPGVPIPEIPKATHGEPGSGLLPYVTARNAVGRLPRNATHHDPQLATRLTKLPWNPDQPCRHTILTTNSECYHWDGLRNFTNRELATLQGFPISYNFAGSRTDVQKQIGNAVPPICFKGIFEECIKTLRKLDQQQKIGGGDGGDGSHDNFIDLVEDQADEIARRRRSAAVPPPRTSSRILSPNIPSSQSSTGSARQIIAIDDDEAEAEDDEVIVLD